MSFNYSNGIIYKIACNDTTITDCYVGSTTNFKQRKARHKNVCNKETNKAYNLRVYKFIRDNGGWQNWSMVEIEKYPCNDKRELEARERYWLETLKASLNHNIPTRTQKEYHKEYYEENKDKIKEYQKTDKRKEQQKEYHEKNRDTIKEYKKEWYQENKDEILEKRKEYHKKNKDKISEYNKEYREKLKYKIKEYKTTKIECNCGVILNRDSISYHKKSKKHKFYQSIYDFIYG